MSSVCSEKTRKSCVVYFWKCQALQLILAGYYNIAFVVRLFHTCEEKTSVRGLLLNGIWNSCVLEAWNVCMHVKANVCMDMNFIWLPFSILRPGQGCQRWIPTISFVKLFLFDIVGAGHFIWMESIVLFWDEQEWTVSTCFFVCRLKCRKVQLGSMIWLKCEEIFQ